MLSLLGVIVALVVLAIGALAARIYRGVKRDLLSEIPGPTHKIGYCSTNIKNGFSARKLPDRVDAVVVGSGLGGLSVAALLAREGKKVVVLEQHDRAGGCTHTFEEKGYEFDTGLHYVGGMGCNSQLRKVFDYITDKGLDWEEMDDAYDIAVNTTTNERIEIRKSWRGFAAELKKHFPEDTKAIDDYVKLMRDVKKAITKHYLTTLVPNFIGNILSKLNFDSKYEEFASKTTFSALSDITNNQKLIGVLCYMWGDVGLPPKSSSLVHHCQIVCHYSKGAFYPTGGATQVAATIVGVIERAGGSVFVRGKVDQILITTDKNNKHKVEGVIVKGTRICCPVVISAVGALTTLYKLIPEPQKSLLFPSQWSALRDRKLEPSMSLFSVFIGLSADKSELNLPNHNLWCFSDWDHDKAVEEMKDGKPSAFFMSFPSSKEHTWEKRHPGKSVALVILPCRFSDFEEHQGGRVRHRGDRYEAKKQPLVDKALALMYRIVPQTVGKVDFVEAGSPLSNNYYLGTLRGEAYGLSGTPSRWARDWITHKTGVEGLYFSGQDTLSPGIAGAVMSGFFCRASMDKGFVLDHLSLL